jgi:hypothetical protein
LVGTKHTLSVLLAAVADGQKESWIEYSTLFVSLDQQNQQPFSNVFLSQQTNKQYFQPE